VKFKPGDVVAFYDDDFLEVYLVLEVIDNYKKLGYSVFVLKSPFKYITGKIVFDYLPDGSLLKDLKLNEI